MAIVLSSETSKSATIFQGLNLRVKVLKFSCSLCFKSLSFGDWVYPM
ncbi:hypothetical protein OF897_02475 [Chryseobacterium formosus]|uniref:Uncharacterized protein n=1 Tax=Chryseobacterium formosus TaxID=1537363 RepID=A0ABT3XKX7_9FLAO|nr:hypothetical protein [Chryseobacterium formosus]